LSGTAEAGATVTIKDGTSTLGTATADSSGNWNFTPGTDLLNGSHSFTATATDVAGNIGSASSAYSYNLDATAPAVNSIAITAANGAQNSTLNAGDTVSVSVSMSEVVTVSGTPQLALNIGGTTVQASYASGSGSNQLVFTYTIQAGQTDANGISINSNALTLNGGTIRDAAGNDAALSSTAVTDNGSYKVDTTAPNAPTISSITDDVPAQTGAIANGGLSNDARPTLNGTAEAGATVTIKDGTSTLGTATANASGNWNFTPAADLSNGSHSFTATATDAAGNTGSASSAYSYNLDATAPVAPSAPDLVNASDSGSSDTDNLTNITTPTFTGTAESGSTVTIYSDGVAVGTGTATGGTYTIAATTALTTGTHSITAKATDGAGNTSVASSGLSVKVDATAPTVNNIVVSGDGTVENGDEQNFTVSGTVSDASDGSVVVEIYNGTTLLGSVDGTYSSGAFAVNVTGLTLPANGSYSVKVAATDAAGNAMGSPAPQNFTSTACFMPGTLIATPDGERAIETLAIGDIVSTHDGGAAPIRWIGRNTVSMVFADKLRTLPIRVMAGALGENVPARDLLVSPDHALLVGGVLVQAGALVNDVTILRETNVPSTFVYYHVELADHALILAEGAPAETFIDNVDRMAFDNWEEHERLYGAAPGLVEMDLPRAKAARQVPQHVRAIIGDRAVVLGGGIQFAA